MSIIDCEIAKQTLISFFSDMYEWEVKGIAIKDSTTYWPLILGKQLEAIYSQYLTAKTRAYGRLILKDSVYVCTSVGAPPEYDCKCEFIQEIFENKKNLIIETNRINPIAPSFSFKMRYYFLLENGKSLLSKTI